jgi:hypothetical protein
LNKLDVENVSDASQNIIKSDLKSDIDANIILRKENIAKYSPNFGRTII